jgi:hypothetical protein
MKRQIDQRPARGVANHPGRPSLRRTSETPRGPHGAYPSSAAAATDAKRKAAFDEAAERAGSRWPMRKDAPAGSALAEIGQPRELLVRATATQLPADRRSRFLQRISAAMAHSACCEEYSVQRRSHYGSRSCARRDHDGRRSLGELVHPKTLCRREAGRRIRARPYFGCQRLLSINRSLPRPARVSQRLVNAYCQSVEAAPSVSAQPRLLCYTPRDYA